VVDDATLDLDYVRLRFATRPGDRHIVEINGHDFGGFRKSDLKFLRLLLAAARKNGKDDGWIDKSRLRDGSDKDPALNDLRADLAKYEVPGLSEQERKALLRVQRGEGLIRLGVPPENIELDESLAQLEFVATTTTHRCLAKRRPRPRLARVPWIAVQTWGPSFLVPLRSRRRCMLTFNIPPWEWTSETNCSQVSPAMLTSFSSLTMLTSFSSLMPSPRRRI